MNIRLRLEGRPSPHPRRHLRRLPRAGLGRGARRTVTLRALDAPHNGCTCPDFATNLLGTCKHVEAVLHHLRADAPRRWKRAVAEGPAQSYLHLVFEPEESLGIRLREAAGPAERRIAARFFGPEGSLRGKLEAVWPELARSATDAGVELPAEVVRLGEPHAEAERSERLPARPARRRKRRSSPAMRM